MPFKLPSTINIDSRESHIMALLISFFLTAFILIEFFHPSSFSLITVDKLVISQATQKGIDIGQRVNTFYRLIFYTLGLGTVFYLTTLKLIQKGILNRSNKNVLKILSIAGIGAATATVLGVHSPTVLASIAGLLMVYFSLILYVNFNHKAQFLSHEKLFSHLCAQAFLLYLLVVVLWGNFGVIQRNFVLIYLITLLVLLKANYLLCIWAKVSFRKLHSFFIPTSTLPILAFLSIEITLFIKEQQGFFIGYKKLFVGLLLFVIVLNSIAQKFKKYQKYSLSVLSKYTWAPAVLVTFVLLQFYHPVIDQPTEIFELANPANSVLNVFQYHEIPLVDFMSSHMLSEQWYGYLYTSLFGYSSMPSFWIYEFLNVFVFIFVLYLFLNKIFKSTYLSTLFILTFPFLFEVFYVHIMITVVVLEMFLRIEKSPSQKNYLLLFCTITASLLWRLDTGASAILTSLFFAPIFWIATKQQIHLMNLSKAMAWFIGGVGIALLTVCFLRSPQYLFDHLNTALHYITTNQAHGYAQLSANFPIQFSIYHLLFPFLSCVAILYLFFKLRKDQHQLEFSKFQNRLLKSSLFLFIATLANAQRGLVRHGFAEGNESFFISVFFIATSLLILFFVSLNGKKKSDSVFQYFYLTSLSLFVFLKFFSNLDDKMMLEKSTTDNAFMSISDELQEDKFVARMVPNEAFAKHNYDSLAAFLNHNINANQTFLDFSNTPMLYFYCKRQIPGYFNQNLQNTIDDFLQFELLKELDTANVPVVIYSNFPTNWFDQTDGVQNTLRYYLIAEYIHKNYKPYNIINGKCVWIAKHLDIPVNNYRPDVYKFLAPFDHHGLTAGYIGSFYQNQEHQNHLKQVFYKEFSSNPDSVIVDLPESILRQAHTYIVISLADSNQEATEVPITLTANDHIGQITFTHDNIRFEHGTYYLRISSYYYWHINNTCTLTIKNNGGVAIKKVSVLKDLRFED